MLILTRREGEAIVINETITIRLVKAGDGFASVEIDAPEEVVIVRKELLPGSENKPA